MECRDGARGDVCAGILRKEEKRPSTTSEGLISLQVSSPTYAPTPLLDHSCTFRDHTITLTNYNRISNLAFDPSVHFTFPVSRLRCCIRRIFTFHCQFSVVPHSCILLRQLHVGIVGESLTSDELSSRQARTRPTSADPIKPGMFVGTPGHTNISLSVQPWFP